MIDGQNYASHQKHHQAGCHHGLSVKKTHHAYGKFMWGTIKGVHTFWRTRPYEKGLMPSLANRVASDPPTFSDCLTRCTSDTISTHPLLILVGMLRACRGTLLNQMSTLSPVLEYDVCTGSKTGIHQQVNVCLADSMSQMLQAY